ncbi:glycogen synthase GlgA [Sinorhizobium numidicum]|uniref:Glycogen synthase n=1 Tax=Sinorhizobium numidicum TaxID=680248 RepID=A0ABY8CMC7_9HYPH|nr:glycogen synthase GlgA [Sinorhizobium numidicum]WEX73832.1 glycogen synthase GlgA [Sinorhizobium numidicum]WEX79816.1 glycogen synthase GlgA [Sinorhizobium numidicum]
MNILSVAAEIYPLVKTGGLADVTGSLPKALKSYGIQTHSIVPGYPGVMEALGETSPIARYDSLFGEPATIVAGQAAGLDLFVLDAPGFFNRPGGPYTDGHGHDFPDNWKRFAAFAFAASQIAHGLIPNWRPDIIHAHDWHSALSLVYLKFSSRPAIPRILTVHNLAFQGQFAAHHFSELGLPDEAYSIDGVEYYGDIGYLKGGLQAADVITVVSPTYAREIMTPAFGMGLEGLMNARHDDIVGIVNGIDMEVWDPSTDPHIDHHYSARTPMRRLLNRCALLDLVGLPNTSGPVFASVNRLTWQKGMDLLAGTADEIVAGGGKLIVLGQGEPDIEHAFMEVARRFPQSVAVKIGYDEPLAHRIHAGADAMLVPSRFEPCGLTQLYALRYGCVPIVARTGGLSETIIDANEAALHAHAATGIQFSPGDASGLRHALRRAFKLFRRHRVWERLRRQGMKTDCSWHRSAATYAELYEEVLATDIRLAG